MRSHRAEAASVQRKKRFPVAEHIFDVLTEEAQYWLGFLMADGCVQESGRITTVTQVADRSHLESLRSFVGANNHGIYMRNRGTTVAFAFTSLRMANRLKYLGLVPRKSLVAKASPELYASKYFWLGVIDGDGCLSFDRHNNSPTLQVAGAYPLMEQFRQYLSSVFAWSPGQLSRKGNIVVVNVHRGKAIAAIRHFWSGHKYGLPRKRAIAERFMAEYTEMAVLEKPKTSIYRGVALFSPGGCVLKKPWNARAFRKHLGYYATAEEAAIAYNRAVVFAPGGAGKINDLTSSPLLESIFADFIKAASHAQKAADFLHGLQP